MEERKTLFKHYEIARRFGIPTFNTANWSKEYLNHKDGWRANLYVELEKIYANELSQEANKQGI